MKLEKALLIHEEIMEHALLVAKKHGCKLLTGSGDNKGVQYKGRIVMQELSSFPPGTKFKDKK